MLSSSSILFGLNTAQRSANKALAGKSRQTTPKDAKVEFKFGPEALLPEFQDC